jgi:prephenate dehydratase
MKTIESDYKEIRNLPNVAIQGIEGSFHHIATMKYYDENVNLISCNRFNDIFKNLDNNTAECAVMAIENSVAGTILPNYALLRQANYQIVGEVYLRIKHQLLTIDNQKIETINKVYSHPMALLQCQHFFKKYPHIKLIESDDTAASAKRLAENREKNAAVIASSLAGDIFDLEVLASDIEDNKRNFTRFLILERNPISNLSVSKINKVSICFHLSHEVGSLSKVLTLLAACKVNLTKIQSLPLVGYEWQYRFHLDMEFTTYQFYQNGLKKIKPFVETLQILGEYEKGKTY